MGIETMLIASLASGFLSSTLESNAAAKQAKAEMEEFRRQEEENNRIAAEEKSDRALQADKERAAAIAAMEAIGGYGSANDERLQMEIAGTAGLDLARIETNRTSRNAQLRAGAKAARNAAKAKQNAALGKFVGGAFSAVGDYQVGLEREFDRTAAKATAKDSAVGYGGARWL